MENDTEGAEKNGRGIIIPRSSNRPEYFFVFSVPPPYKDELQAETISPIGSLSSFPPVFS
jgi:hypothetical protein